MKTIKCENCDTKNSIPTHQSNQTPKCGNCGTYLSCREKFAPYIECENCDTKNRIPTHESNLTPKCGECGKSLLEPVKGKSGYIYILSNPTMEKLIKIGISEDTDRRKNDLYNTSVAQPFKLEYSALTKDYHSLERQVHSKLGSQRPNKNREFFTASIPEAINTICELAGKRIKYQKIYYKSPEEVELERKKREKIAKERQKKAEMERKSRIEREEKRRYENEKLIKQKNRQQGILWVKTGSVIFVVPLLLMMIDWHLTEKYLFLYLLMFGIGTYLVIKNLHHW